jgi:C1A family cysteine protease
MKLPFLIKINFVSVISILRNYIFGRRISKKKFGLIRDKWDARDYYYKLRAPGKYPVSTNRKNISEFTYRYDQRNIGSCVGHGVVEAFRRVLQVNHMPDWNPSRLFAYWIARDDKDNDTGASIRDAFKAINEYGLCSENSWPYKTELYADKPSEKAFREALEHQAIRYERIYPVTKEAIMDAVSQGFPVVYGKQLYESFMSDRVAKIGIVPAPRTCREKLVGGHCMVIFDYDEFGTIELNSWGDTWGYDGTCVVPWDYVLNSKLTHDFWVLYKTE